ncbi:macrophage mannose receptor 1-like isoform X3 [Macrosteles quadrilineatus]|uniref:macrophage mannose receptor 1-like isoform X3 n=1 Tax=Macrosteles quadrilineatus TaxID=74068 RepID=UPI0023E209DA|nr:macrophage mannose receptor 1-like isoform X3 [Macrosteles quadrilineatus]
MLWTMLRSVYPIFCLVLVVAEPNSTASKHGFIRTKRQGPDERSCILPQPMVNGRYSPNINRCPPHVSNAACKIVPGTPVPSGWDLYYECDDGFFLNSTDTVSFCTDGNWSPSLPECIAGVPCLPLKSQYLNIKCSFQGKIVSCDQPMKPGTIASPKCKSNYKPAYQIPYSYITCLDVGYFDNPLFYCIPEKLCPPLKAPNNMKVQYIYQGKVVRDDQLKPGTIAIPRCKYNYRPAYEPGYTHLTCLNSGSWDQQLFYCTAVCGASNEVGQLTPLIVDGVQANVGAFPWHAGLYYRDFYKGREIWDQRCGGSLINDQFVLTAAHCVARVRNVADLRVALGKYFRSWDIHEHTEERRNVSMILFPWEFNEITFIFDIALLMLDVKIKPGGFIMPVCHGFLDGLNYIKDKNLFVVGWGKKENGMISKTLLYNDVTPVPSYECNQRAPSGFPTFEKFCASKNSSELSIAQPGDSGGGVTAVYEGLHYLFGLISVKFEKTTYFSNITWPYNMIWMEGEVKKYHPSFTWVEHEFLDNPDQPKHKSCMLPRDSDNRKFCSLAEHCDSCDARCIIPAGSQATRVRVVCNPGYSLRGAVDDVYSGGDIATCLSRGSWYPRIPECIKVTGKRYIAGDPWIHVSWEQAKQNCIAKGRQLAVIKSEDQQKMFEDAANEKFEENREHSRSIWIGLRDEAGYRSLALRFVWIDGQPLRKDDFSPWREGEPNNAGWHEDCVIAKPENGKDPNTSYKWKDVCCYHRNFYICSKGNSANDYVPGEPWVKVTWKEADELCHMKGHQLAIISNEGHSQAFAATAAHKFRETGSEAEELWIGLKTLERRFKWVDNSPLGSYTNWLPSEPTNAGGGELCVKAEGRRDVEPLWPNAKPYQWNGVWCTAKRSYFCEDKTDSTESNIAPGDPWTKVTWHEARKNCDEIGKRLVVLKTKEKIQRFKEAAVNIFRSKGESPSSTWIGLADWEWEGRFTWLTGQPLRGCDFSAWGTNEPNNNGGHENCVHAIPEAYKNLYNLFLSLIKPNDAITWNDDLCRLKKFYFCSEGGTVDGNYVPGNPWTKVTWQEASDNCQAQGHKLAVVINQEQQKKFEEAVARYLKSLKDCTIGLSLWIGLSSEDRKFKWMDGTELELPDWLPGEPNIVGGSENCVEAIPEESNRPNWPGGKPYQWNDGNCPEKKRYFCQEEILDRY